jgi:hypothetical protein
VATSSTFNHPRDPIRHVRNQASSEKAIATRRQPR